VSVHLETLVAATPHEVFALLTNGASFGAATGMPAAITDREGEPFSLFGGRIEGRQIELVPGERVVQAWRFGAAHPSPWEPGVYSTVRFALEPTGDETRLVIDHTGIPPEWVDHLTQGYPAFYLDPITSFFAHDARPIVRTS
jgi:activator of HSP90 ATPase